FALLWVLGSACAIGAATQAKFHRLAALILTGGAGLVSCVSFVWLSAPDLAATQLLVEVVTTILILLGLRWLPKRIQGLSPDARLTRVKRWRDALVALTVGAGVASLAYAAMMHPVFNSISRFFLERAYVDGGGHNVVNVILVDFRGFDTLGEITVRAIVAITVFVLLRRFRPAAESSDRLRLQRRNSVMDLAGSDRVIDQSTADYMMIPGLIVQLMSPVILLFGIHLFLRGHDLPGGGFAAGITVSVALILLYMARGARWVETHLRVKPVRWIGFGLLLAVGTGLGSLVFRYPFLTSHFQYAELPVGAHPDGHRGAVRPRRVLPGGRRRHADAGGAGAPVAAQAEGFHDRRCRRQHPGGGQGLMELVLAIAIGVLVASGVWLLLRPRTFQVIIGLTLISYGVNLFIFSTGGLRIGADPVLRDVVGKFEQYTDPLPQALVLTAIVIGFATTALFLVVLLTSRGLNGNDHVDGGDGSP